MNSLDLEALRQIVRRTFALASPLDRYRTGVARRRLDGNVAFVAGGEPGASFNFAAVFGPIAAEALLAQAVAFFGSREPFSVALEAERAGPLERELVRRGWTLDEEEPALVLPRLPRPLPAPPAVLEVRRVRDATGL